MQLKHLFLLIIASALTAIYFELARSPIYGYLKALTTILIIFIPVVIAKNSSNQLKRLVIAGLIFCLIGDILLLSEERFIAGLISFLIAHLLFSYAFYYQNKKQLRYLALIPFIIIGGVYYVFLLPHLGAIAIPVAIYISVIILMSWQASVLFINKTSSANFAILSGAILFLISDSVLAYNKFVASFSYSGVVILITYWLAITLFAYSTLPLNKTRNINQ